MDENPFGLRRGFIVIVLVGVLAVIWSVLMGENRIVSVFAFGLLILFLVRNMLRYLWMRFDDAAIHWPTRVYG